MTLRGQKPKITVLDVKYVENGKSYDVGPNEHDFRSHRQQPPALCQESLAFLFDVEVTYMLTRKEYKFILSH